MRKGSSRKEVAAFLGCTVSTLSLKMTEKTPFTLPEATKIKAFLDVDLSIEELFQSDVPQKEPNA